MFNLILSVVLGIIALVLLAIFINKIPRKLHIVIILVLLALIGFFGYKLFQSIAEPVKFEEVKEERYEKVVAQLIRLRDAQVAHKLITGKYTDDIEALAKFIDTAQFALTQKRDSSVIDVDKNKRYGLSGTGGYYKEITMIDTLGFKSVKDSLFSNVDIRSLLKYPIEGAQGQITLKKGTITDGNNQLQVFEARAMKKDILFDQPERLLQRELEIKAVEAIDGDAIIVGSLEEVSTSGNWPRQYALTRGNK
jgi:Ca2+/Na+ antiporter